MKEQLEAADIDETIKRRRTVKTEKMNGKIIPDDTISELLALADWAPTHARTEPWRFIVITPARVNDFVTRHANLYQQHANPSSFTQEKFNKLLQTGDNVSHIIIAWMKRVPTHKIPAVEEVAATAAAIQNLLLGATSRGIASFWSTGGLTHHQAMKDEFKLGDEDIILGFIFLGYSDEPIKDGTRIIPLTEKVEWVR